MKRSQSIARACFLVASAASITTASAVDRLVANQSELVSALGASGPGDTVTLKNGIWNNLNVNFQSINGSVAAPVHIRAQTPGQVVISGPTWFFDLGGHDYKVSGLTFKDENTNLKSIRFRGSGANVYDNAMLLGGRYHQVIWDAQPDSAGNPSQFHHNFAAGKQDRGLIIQLDLSYQADVHHNYFGNRPEGGPSGNTNGWETIRIGNSGIMDSSLQADIHHNYFESTNGEAETVSDKTHDNRVRDNTFRNVTKGWITARHGGDGIYERNQFFNALGIRVGNNDDTIADHPGITIRNNYIEGPNAKILLPGYQTDARIENNSVIVTSGSYNNAGYTTGKFPMEYTNTTAGTISGNLLWISDSTYAAMQAGTLGGIAPVASGAGNVAYNAGAGPTFASATPNAIRNLFTSTNPQFVRDAYGLQRPTAAGLTATGAGPLAAPLARNSDVGASWLDPVTRLNKFTPLELRFNGDYADGITSPTAHNTGYLSTPALLKNGSGTLTNLHSTSGLGVSGLPGDMAFDNRATTTMGNNASGRAAVVDRQWFRKLEAFTITGWFKTDGTQTLGNGASLIEQSSGATGWSLRANTNGVLTLAINTGTATSNAAYTAAGAWQFFAVTFDARPSSNEVSFYAGSESSNVALVNTRSLGQSASSDTVTSDLLIGLGFDGLLDNIRLFAARQDYTYIDDTGSSFTKNMNGQDYALLSLAELRTVRRFDLGILPGDVNESRSINAADIDQVRINQANAAFDVDGDFDADRADFELLVGHILGTAPGDANLDRRIDIDDFGALAANFNASGGWAAGNFNLDGVVNIDDFGLLAAGFNQQFAASARAVGVPEPAFPLLAAAVACFLRRGRRTSGRGARFGRG